MNKVKISLGDTVRTKSGMVGLITGFRKPRKSDAIKSVHVFLRRPGMTVDCTVTLSDIARKVAAN